MISGCKAGGQGPPQITPTCDPAQRSQFGKEEGASGYGAFAAPAETEWSWLLLTPRRFFSFSKKRKKRMGSKTLPVCAERRQPPLGKGAFEWTESSAPAGVKVNFKSCKRADEGSGPYKHNRSAAQDRKKQSASLWTEGGA